MGGLTIPWPPERETELTRLVKAGKHSYSQIGTILGITKNAAIGKARRMELEGPRSVGPVREDTTTLSRLEALDKFPDRGCLYPIGHPGEDDFRFCGNNRDGGSYCLFHRRKAYIPEKMGKIEDAA